MDRNEVVIVIPMYKTDLEWHEHLALKRVFDVLDTFPIIICCPESLDLSTVHQYFKINKEERFRDSYFTGIDSYNNLVMSLEFYERFICFKYMLIYQLDAFVFVDKLKYFCSLGYDYIGAPWTQPVGVCKFKKNIYHLKVGNGGFSLRRVRACLDVLRRYSDVLAEWHENEDSFFAYCGYINPEMFRVAPFRVAMKFSFEASVRRLYKKNNYALPFGCHAWMKFGGDVYPSIFKKAGVDVDEYNNWVGFEDLKYEISRIRYRLYTRMIRANSFFEILPYNKSWSIVCFGKIGKNLAKCLLNDGFEINSIYDSMVSKDLTEWNGIRISRLADIEHLNEERGRIIISTLSYEMEMLEMFKNAGWTYGVDFISLCREYASRFNGLGYEKYLYTEFKS